MKLKSPTEINDSISAETRRELLEAAGEVFAEGGFHNATVREICRRAGANIAAVNYHFGDKETLYTEVLRYSQQKALERYPVLLDVKADAAPEKKLRAYVHSLLLRILDKGPTAWHGKLMSREMIEPTAALDSMVEEKFRPLSEQLRSIVAEILGGKADEARVRLCSYSVVSQCVFYHHCQPVILRLDPQQHFDAAGVEQLSEHITNFSLAAMKSFRSKK
jgi:AcrR family transcriptional regulator